MEIQSRNDRSRRSLRNVLLFSGIVAACILVIYSQQLVHLSVLKINDIGSEYIFMTESDSVTSISPQEIQLPDKRETDDGNSTEGNKPQAQPRILLYVTSHLPTSHEELLHRCWPYVLSNSKLVQMADVKVFLTGELFNQYADGEVFRYIFREKIWRNQFSMHQVENPGYQEGAIAAMAMGQKNGWFEGYDWVIRLNADVIIKDDTMLLTTILSSETKNVTGIFVDCYKTCNTPENCRHQGYLIHSDFTAFKPSTLSPTLQWNEAYSAESMNNFAFQSVVDQGQDRWLVDSFPNNAGICRLSTGETASVSHFGDGDEGTTQRCVEWFKGRNMTLDSNF